MILSYVSFSSHSITQFISNFNYCLVWNWIYRLISVLFKLFRLLNSLSKFRDFCVNGLVLKSVFILITVGRIVWTTFIREAEISISSPCKLFAARCCVCMAAIFQCRCCTASILSFWIEVCSGNAHFYQCFQSWIKQ